MFRLATIVILCNLFILPCVSNPVPSTSVDGHQPESFCKRMRFLFGRILQSVRRILTNFRNGCKNTWNNLTKTTRKEPIHITEAVTVSLSVTENTSNAYCSTSVQSLVFPIRHHFCQQRSLTESDIKLIIRDTSGFEDIDDFFVREFDLRGVLQAICTEQFLDNVCIKGAEDVSKAVWETEGPWYQRSIHGKVRKNPIVQPTFKQIHRFGYIAESSVFYVISQEITVNLKAISAKFEIALRLLLDGDAAGVRIRTSFRIHSSGSRLITIRGTSQARDYARLDYQQAQPVLMGVLNSGIIPRLSKTTSLVEGQYGSDASSSVFHPHAAVPIRWMLSTRVQSKHVRSVAVSLIGLMVALIIANAKLIACYER